MMQAVRFERHLKIALDAGLKIGHSAEAIHPPGNPTATA